MSSDLPSEQPNMNFHASIGWFNQVGLVLVDHLLEPVSKIQHIREQKLPLSLRSNIYPLELISRGIYFNFGRLIFRTSSLIESFYVKYLNLTSYFN